MALAPKDEKMVRYRVKGKVHVNGMLIDPEGRRDVFVMARPGLEGRALELAKDEPRAAANAPGNGGIGGAI